MLDDTALEDMNKFYCPICQRFVPPENSKEVESGEHDGYLFVHDDVPHSEEDMEALENGIN